RIPREIEVGVEKEHARNVPATT
ncbi:MAG: hypothetical protein QOE14_2572, partial [Humisphaera sp.]|nr:hypothetical protein [Humisphaera sp.]